MSDPASRDWRLHLDDMLRFAGKVLAYSQGLDQAAFVADSIVYDATLRNLELIGEAATKRQGWNHPMTPRKPRILLEDPARSHVAAARVTAHDAEFTGQVKCVYNDPPYNTGSAFEHDDDGIEHSPWLTCPRFSYQGL